MAKCLNIRHASPITIQTLFLGFEGAIGPFSRGVRGIQSEKSKIKRQEC